MSLISVIFVHISCSFNHRFIPESPRWLVQKGRMSEAKCILTQMAIFNKRPVPNFAKLEYYVAVSIPWKDN